MPFIIGYINFMKKYKKVLYGFIIFFYFKICGSICIKIIAYSRPIVSQQWQFSDAVRNANVKIILQNNILIQIERSIDPKVKMSEIIMYFFALFTFN